MNKYIIGKVLSYSLIILGLICLGLGLYAQLSSDPIAAMLRGTLFKIWLGSNILGLFLLVFFETCGNINEYIKNKKS